MKSSPGRSRGPGRGRRRRRGWRRSRARPRRAGRAGRRRCAGADRGSSAISSAAIGKTSEHVALERVSGCRRRRESGAADRTSSPARGGVGDLAERPLGDVERRVRGRRSSVRLTPMRAPVPSSEMTGAATESTPSTPRELLGERGQLALPERRGAGDVDVGRVGGAGGEGALDVLVRLRGLGVGGKRARGVVAGGVEGGAGGQREHRAAGGERHPAGAAGDQLPQPLEACAVGRRLPALGGPEDPRADECDRGRDQGQARDAG